MDGPVRSPTDWLQLVNQPQTEAEVAALRCSVNSGRPFGDPNWVTATAKRLGLESTVRPRGRPKKQSLACCVYSDLILQIWWLSPFMSPGTSRVREALREELTERLELLDGRLHEGDQVIQIGLHLCASCSQRDAA